MKDSYNKTLNNVEVHKVKVMMEESFFNLFPTNSYFGCL